jgi:hypothetical protein
MSCLPKIDPGTSCKGNFVAIRLKMVPQPISYRFFYEATYIISSRFIFEATWSYHRVMLSSYDDNAILNLFSVKLPENVENTKKNSATNICHYI